MLCSAVNVVRFLTQSAASTLATARVLRGGASARAPALLCAAAFAVCALPSAAPGSSGGESQAPARATPGKSDQLSVRSKRDGSLQLLSGSVTTNNLDHVVVSVGGKDNKLDSELVVRITWGDVPAAYKDGRVYLLRDQFSDAAAQFRLCAADPSARDVVKASARLLAAQSLLRWGASDPLHFSAAAEEAGKFLAEFPMNREVPEVRMLQARAKWMAGQTSEAAQLYKSIYAEWTPTSSTPGYRRDLCLEAALYSARAMCQVQPPDTLGARELYTSLDKAAAAALAGLEANDPSRARLIQLRDEGALGDGFAELASGNSPQAMTFFQGKLATRATSTDTLRFGASFGLAQALRAGGKLREAQIEFARVIGLDHSDRDRVAEAHLGLADTTLKLADPDSVPQAKAWLDAVATSLGDTLAARRAREMLQKL